MKNVKWEKLLFEKLGESRFRPGRAIFMNNMPFYSFIKCRKCEGDVFGSWRLARFFDEYGNLRLAFDVLFGTDPIVTEFLDRSFGYGHAAKYSLLDTIGSRRS